jgi:hypothetical protein
MNAIDNCLKLKLSRIGSSTLCGKIRVIEWVKVAIMGAYNVHKYHEPCQVRCVSMEGGGGGGEGGHGDSWPARCFHQAWAAVGALQPAPAVAPQFKGGIESYGLEGERGCSLTSHLYF